MELMANDLLGNWLNTYQQYMDGKMSYDDMNKHLDKYMKEMRNSNKPKLAKIEDECRDSMRTVFNPPIDGLSAVLGAAVKNAAEQAPARHRTEMLFMAGAFICAVVAIIITDNMLIAALIYFSFLLAYIGGNITGGLRSKK